MFQQLREGVRDWLRADDERQLTDISLEYAYKDLYDATQGFGAETRLGAGAAGAVYRGTLRGGTEVAIKVLLVNGGLNGFEDEVRVLSRFRHPNLVTLLGWGQSRNEKEKYLIYELLEGGDVGGRLEKSRNGRVAFPWQQRLRVALDSACGLSHMVNSSPKAFHRDIKPANILLDAGGGAKMADFGLAGTIRDQESEHMTVDNISGTPGYACPVYIQTGRVTEQTEVYSFGIVLLELLVNQPPALAGPQGDIIYPLLQTVQPAAPGAHARVLASLDPRAQWPPGVVIDQFSNLALACVDMVPERRPPFENIVMVLRRLVSAAGSFEGGGLRTPPRPAPTAPLPPQPHHQARDRRPVEPATPSGSTPSPQPPGAGARGAPLGEVVLSCAKAEGLDLSTISTWQRSLGFAVDPSVAATGRWTGPVGRQHHPELFEQLVVNKERLSSISRTHFELVLPEGAEGPLSLRKLSGNPLLVDGRPLGQQETVSLFDGSHIAFTGTSSADPSFLELKVRLRSQQQVQSEGPHPCIAASLGWGCQGPGGANAGWQGGGGGASASSSAAAAGGRGAAASRGEGAILECVGALSSDLAALGPEAKAISLPLDETIEVGRSQQVGFFEQLLQAEPAWLAFISRTHCRVQLTRSSPSPQQQAPGGASAPPPLWLKVENLSTNPVFICGRLIPKGRSDVLPENGILSFRAKGRDEKETTFLELKLRRPRGQFRL